MQDVAAERDDVDPLVRRVVDAVEPRERAGLARERAEPLHVDERSDCVARDRAGDDAGAVGELALEVVEVERQVLVHVDEVDVHPPVRGELDPRRRAAVVVEARDDHLVALAPVASGGAAEREVHRGHVHPEHDLVGCAAEEPCAVALRLREDGLDPLSGLVGRTEVRARLAQRACDRLADLVGNLGAAGRVEEREPGLERGVAAADRLDVEQRRAHARPSPAAAPAGRSPAPPPPGAADGTVLSGPVLLTL